MENNITNSNTIIYKMLLQQAIFQQYLIHICLCSWLDTQYFTIVINGIIITLLLMIYHLKPFTQNKFLCFLEYLLLIAIQAFLMLYNQGSIYVCAILCGLELVKLIFRIIRGLVYSDFQDQLLKLCLYLLKCLLSLQLMLLALKQNNVIQWSWFQTFMLLWFILLCSTLFQACLIVNLIFRTISRIFFMKQEMKEMTEFRYYGGLWYTIQIQCCTVNPTLTLICFCTKQMTLECLIIIASQWLLSLIISCIIFNKVKLYYQQVTQLLQSPTITQENEDRFLNERFPKYLLRISQTYYKDVSYNNNNSRTNEKKFEKLFTSPRKSTEMEIKCLICFENECNYVLMNCGHGISLIIFYVDYV